MATGGKKQRRADEAAKKKTARNIKLTGWAIALALAAAAGVAYYIDRADLPGQKIPTLGRTHISQNSPTPSYNSVPPTSGAHSGATRWGYHQAEIPEINQVHNLEHGGILIQYNCDRLGPETSCAQLLGALRPVFDKARREVHKKIILAPYGKLERPIALTAWTWLQYLDEVDEAAILTFADRHINNAPENVP